jgi:hypothetical protein
MARSYAAERANPALTGVLDALPSASPRAGSGSAPLWERVRRSVSLEPAAKFFVNSGLVSTPTDIYNLLRPLLKQTVSYRYYRGGTVISSGTGWVERIVVDRPEVSTFFTPLSICLNIDSFEHLEFETRPDQLIEYTLVQGDERIVVEFAPVGRSNADEPEQQRFAFPATIDYVQMELSVLDGGEASDSAGEVPEGS